MIPLLLALTLASTSTAPEDRTRMLAEGTCATTLKRADNFLRLGGGGEATWYDPDKMGYHTYDLLGDLHAKGCAKADLAPNPATAALWFQRGAAVHVPESQWKLGRMLYEGRGIPADRERGLIWLTSAAFEGSAEAAGYLSKAGYPVPQPITPNTYEREAARARGELAAAQAAERSRVVSDLGRFMVGALTSYVQVQSARVVPQRAAAPRVERATSQPISTRTSNAPKLAPPPVPTTMTLPAYCSAYASPGVVIGEIVYVNVSAFCY